MFQRKKKASRFKGVYKCGNKWKAQIQSNGIQHYLGVFDTEEMAAAVYNQVAQQLHPPLTKNSVYSIPIDSASAPHNDDADTFAEMLAERDNFKYQPSFDKNTAGLQNTMTTMSASSSELEVMSEDQEKVVRWKLRLGQIIRQLSQLNAEVTSPNNHTHDNTLTSFSLDSSLDSRDKQILSLLQEQRDIVSNIVACASLSPVTSAADNVEAQVYTHTFSSNSSSDSSAN